MKSAGNSGKYMLVDGRGEGLNTRRIFSTKVPGKSFELRFTFIR